MILCFFFVCLFFKWNHLYLDVIGQNAFFIPTCHLSLISLVHCPPNLKVK